VRTDEVSPRSRLSENGRFARDVARDDPLRRRPTVGDDVLERPHSTPHRPVARPLRRVDLLLHRLRDTAPIQRRELLASERGDKRSLAVGVRTLLLQQRPLDRAIESAPRDEREPQR
jgi:hypothetical protein